MRISNKMAKLHKHILIPTLSDNMTDHNNILTSTDYYKIISSRLGYPNS